MTEFKTDQKHYKCKNRRLFGVGMSGSLGSLITTLVHHPLSQLKTHMQRENFKLSSFFRLSWQYPAKTLYGGIFQRLFVIMPEKSMKMQGFNFCLAIFNQRAESEQSRGYLISKWFVSGAVAGFCTSILIGPSELVTIQATIWRNSLKEIVRVRGVRFLYTGWSACVSREVLFGAIFFSTRHTYQKRIEDKQSFGATYIQKYWAGLVGGVVCSFITTPFDVMKTRMQSINIYGGDKLNLITLLPHMIRNNGVLSLWKGVIPRLIAVPSNLSFFYLCYELFYSITY